MSAELVQVCFHGGPLDGEVKTIQADVMRWRVVVPRFTPGPYGGSYDQVNYDAARRGCGDPLPCAMHPGSVMFTAADWPPRPPVDVVPEHLHPGETVEFERVHDHDTANRLASEFLQKTNGQWIRWSWNQPIGTLRMQWAPPRWHPLRCDCEINQT